MGLKCPYSCLISDPWVQKNKKINEKLQLLAVVSRLQCVECCQVLCCHRAIELRTVILVFLPGLLRSIVERWRAVHNCLSHKELRTRNKTPGFILRQAIVARVGKNCFPISDFRLL